MIEKLQDLDFVQRKLFKVVDKSGQLTLFNPNFYQKKLNALAKDRGMMRMLILKCRQIGASTWGSSYVAHRTMYQSGKSGLIIADDQENTSGLFNMTKRYYSNLPEWAQPTKKYSNEKALVFNNDEGTGLGSQVTVATAGKLSAGRSKTIQYLHASEFAYWPNAATLATGLFQSVPLLPNTGIIIESTANGVSGKGAEFYNRCMRALDGDTDFDFIFFSWLDNPEYELIPMPGFKPTDYEKHLMELYPKLTIPKLCFRRYKIQNEMGSAIIDPEDQFKQEYPLTEMEAFISSGRPVFDTEKIHQQIGQCQKVDRYELSGDRFVKNDRGQIYIRELPKDRMQYAVGADVAEGLKEGDDSAFSVMSKDMRQVAWYCGKIDPDNFGRLLVAIAKFYNGAILAPEQNNHGHATLLSIKNAGYYKVYKREVLEELGSDIQEKVGWLTTAKTKMLMMDDLVAAHRDNSISIGDEATLREMIGISIEDDGNIKLNGKDKTVAIAISLQALKQATVEGENKAFVPGKSRVRDVTKLTLEEKLRYYKRGGR